MTLMDVLVGLGIVAVYLVPLGLVMLAGLLIVGRGMCRTIDARDRED